MAVFITSKFSNTFSILLKHSRGICISSYKLQETGTPKGDPTTSLEVKSEPTTDEKEEDSKYEQDIKTTILNASLPFVNEMGWSRNAIIAGAKTVNYPGTIHGLFPSAGSELVQFFYTQCNTKLANELKEEFGDVTKKQQSGSEIARIAIEKRLRMILPYENKWTQAIAIMSMPQNVPATLANLMTLADDICYYAGDRSVDLTWYSRRIGIAAIYKMTELYLIQDSSEDHTETWQFLNQRISEASAVNKFISTSDTVSNQAKETITSAIIMARNMLGLNWRR